MGDKTLIVFDSGLSWTYSQLRDQARKTAGSLYRQGIRRGDQVLVWLPSTSDIVRLHFGLAYLGAIFVPINLALRGRILEHIITNSKARVIICHSELVERLQGVSLGSVEKMIVFGDFCQSQPPLTDLPNPVVQLSSEVLEPQNEEFPDPTPPIQPWEPHGIFYTSGTTGPPKGVVCPNVHTAIQSIVALRFLTSDDRFLISVPYFYLGGAFIPFGVIAAGASMALLHEYHTQSFWDDVRRTGSTACYVLGAISAFLMKQPARPDDRNNPLRAVIQQPLAHDATEFAKRFGVTVFTQFDMTEIPAAISSGPLSRQRKPAGYCGRVKNVWPYVKVRLVDEFDCEVPDGEVGELVVRCDIPWVIAPMYFGNDKATADAWRNGWFHTGDAFRRDDKGSYFFVDRLKDCIRRRGENISSAMLEAELLQHDDVGDAAAIAVKSEFGEDEVLVAISAKGGKQIAPLELINFLVRRLPHFMVPRYIRILDKMPYTETHKVQKSTLRSEGLAKGTWDREAAGIKIKRTKIGLTI